MAYIVNISTKKTKTQSVPLPNKQRVRKYVRTSPVGKSSTKISIYNTRTKKRIRTTKSGGSIYGWKPK